MHHRKKVLVLVDDRSAALRAFEAFLDRVAPFSVSSITGLYVDSLQSRRAHQMMAPTGIPELAFAGGCGTIAAGAAIECARGPMCAAVAVLNALQRLASDRGLAFSGACRAELGDEAIVEYSSHFDIVIDCRPAASQAGAEGLDPLLRRLLCRGSKPVVRAHAAQRDVARVVIVTRAEGAFEDLCRLGADWPATPAGDAGGCFGGAHSAATDLSNAADRPHPRMPDGRRPGERLPMRRGRAGGALESDGCVAHAGLWARLAPAGMDLPTIRRFTATGALSGGNSPRAP